MKYKEKTYKQDGVKVVDLSLGFDNTVMLDGKVTTEMQMFYNDFKVEIGKPILEYLVEQLGTMYGMSWYFIDESCRIKYFADNEWHIKSIYEFIDLKEE